MSNWNEKWPLAIVTGRKEKGLRVGWIRRYGVTIRELSSYDFDMATFSVRLLLCNFSRCIGRPGRTRTNFQREWKLIFGNPLFEPTQTAARVKFRFVISMRSNGLPIFCFFFLSLFIFFHGYFVSSLKRD